jgi:hypothetical protein
MLLMERATGAKDNIAGRQRLSPYRSSFHADTPITYVSNGTIARFSMPAGMKKEEASHESLVIGEVYSICTCGSAIPGEPRPWAVISLSLVVSGTLYLELDPPRVVWPLDSINFPRPLSPPSRQESQ